MKEKTIIRNLLSKADIAINGSHPWDVQVRDDRFYQRVLSEGELGLGESYMDGWWDCEAMDQFFYKALKARLHEKLKPNLATLYFILKAKLANRQKTSRAGTVAKEHYDLGNDLYKAMLDQRMNYTCGYWRTADTLDDAQEAKLDLVCKKIGLKPGMSVLELGCGWGAFAKYAAEKYNVQVVAYNISKQQVQLARELCKDLPVEFKLEDYRAANGSYDAVISIGILEHVGYKNYREYMQVVDRNLKQDGIAFIHTIGSNITTYSANRWTDKYIFPNGMLPSISQIGEAMEGLFVMEDWHNIGPDYDPTLMAWWYNFDQAWPQLEDRYGDRFYRMWKFYLLSSAGSFRARNQQLWQIVMSRRGCKQPDCRVS